MGEVLHLAGERVGRDLEVAVGKCLGVFGADDVAGVFGGAGLDAFGAVGFIDPGAGGEFLLSIQSAAGEQGVAEFVGFDALAFCVEVDVDLGAFPGGGLHEETGGTGSALSRDIGVVIGGVQRNEI